jgi:hypothetical protein
MTTTTDTIASRAADIAGEIFTSWAADQSDSIRGQLQAVLEWKNKGTDGDMSDDDYEAIRELLAEATVTVRAWDDGSSETVECDLGDDYDAVAEELWDGADYGDGDYRVTVYWEATDSDGDEVDSGSFDVVGHAEEPQCPEADEHDWTSEYEGGCTENPGVWSTGGTSMVFRSHCRHCGMERVERHTGSQRNPGECDTTTYGEPDSEWVKENIGTADSDEPSLDSDDPETWADYMSSDASNWEEYVAMRSQS